MVIRGGENLYPREIEEFLYRHPKIQDVQIFGVADDRYGEELCAWVRFRPAKRSTADEVRAFCQGQIAHNKIPRYVEFVDEFPMTVTGKIQKFVMRDAVEARLGLRRRRRREERAAALCGAPPGNTRTCHHPRKRVIQYAAASRFDHCRLWDTGSPACAGDDGEDDDCNSRHNFAFSRRDTPRFTQ